MGSCSGKAKKLNNKIAYGKPLASLQAGKPVTNQT